MEDKNNKREKWDDPHLTKVTWKTKTVISVKKIKVRYSQQIVSTTYFKEFLVPAAISEKKSALMMWQILFCWPWEISWSNLHCWLSKLSTWNGNKGGISLSKEIYFDEMHFIFSTHIMENHYQFAHSFLMWHPGSKCSLCNDPGMENK